MLVCSTIYANQSWLKMFIYILFLFLITWFMYANQSCVLDWKNKKKRLFISLSIPIKNRNICQDCLYHLAYILKISIFFRLRFFKRSRKKVVLLRALEYCALLNRKHWKNMPQNKIKEIFDPYLAAAPQGRKNPFRSI